ncbi:hypothetical protein [Castellaniella sp.]|uniref:hypothetical protein n=1 Tax=Castellaniella sp. TaxID=1955812 RepID=UPI003569B40A
MNRALLNRLHRLMYWLVMLPLVFGLQVGASRAGTFSWDDTGLPTGPDWAWADPERFDWPAASLDVRPFKAAHGIPAVVDALAARLGRRFDRMQFSIEGLQLSGLWQGQHWLVRLQPTASGTYGVLSVLSPRPVQPAMQSLSTLAPPVCSRVLSMSTRASAGREQLMIYRCPIGARPLVMQVHQSLQAQGWQRSVPRRAKAADTPDADIDDPRFSTDWLLPRFNAVLNVLVRRLGKETALVFWLRPEGS